jgi:hypothetical protein
MEVGSAAGWITVICFAIMILAPVVWFTLSRKRDG